MKPRTYTTPAAFKAALNHRLRNAAGPVVGISRRRQLLVFDRYLPRLLRVLGDTAILEGGLVLELRLDRARTTQDIDLRLVGSSEGLLSRLREAGQIDLGDFSGRRRDARQVAPVDRGAPSCSCAWSRVNLGAPIQDLLRCGQADEAFDFLHGQPLLLQSRPDPPRIEVVLPRILQTIRAAAEEVDAKGVLAMGEPHLANILDDVVARYEARTTRWHAPVPG